MMEETLREHAPFLRRFEFWRDTCAVSPQVEDRIKHLRDFGSTFVLTACVELQP